MHAMVLRSLKLPLEWSELPVRSPGAGELRVRVAACGVCRTDLNVLDGDPPDPVLPMVPGHEIVGRIDALGTGVDASGVGGLAIGQRAGIHMSDIPSFPYRLLWEERKLVSVANLPRQDGLDFLRQVPRMGLVARTTTYPLQQANQALADLSAGRFEGAAVFVP
jgi:D-arabinose 1-dehydrogenase-like Zn-dependent alcohol dehydrogenase